MPQGMQEEDPSAQGQGQDGEGPAEEAIEQIQEGFKTLGQMMQAAGGKLPPATMQLFAKAMQATDAFIQDVTGGGGEEEQQAPKQSGPMAPNANANAKPAPNQEY